MQILARVARISSLLAGLCAAAVACDENPVENRSTLVPVDSLLAEPIQLVRNPVRIAPLTALATIRTRAATSVTLRLLEDDDLVHEVATPSTEHEVPVLGLFPARENHIEVRIATTKGEYGLDTLSVITEPLPEFLPRIDILAADQTLMEPGWTLADFSLGVGSSFHSHPFMFDAEGNIRWYLNLSPYEVTVYMVERLKNGNLILGVGSSVYEYDMVGRQLNRWSFPGYTYHHDVIEKPDGNLIIAVNKEGAGTIEDHVIEIHRTTGAIVREWDLRQALDTRRRAQLANDRDWFHMNSVWYDKRDNSLIVSGRHQGVAKISANNELVWILAPHRGWGRAGVDATGLDTSEFLLTALDGAGKAYPESVQQGETRTPEFDWPWAQHAAMVLPNGNLFLFDNGDQRNFATTLRFSRGVEYAIDERKRTVRQVWEYGRQRGADYFAPIISDVDYLPKTGNRLVVPGIVFGSNPRAYITEVAHPSGRVVFEAKLSFKNHKSTGQLAWGQFDMMYRAERLTPYP